MVRIQENQAGINTKTRRSHRKSRNGCAECKRRHIRCDEGRPACTNCAIAERACSFPLEAPHHHQQRVYSPARSSSSTGSRSKASPIVRTPPTIEEERRSMPPQQSRAPSQAPSLSGPSQPSSAAPPSLPSFNDTFADTAPPSTLPPPLPAGATQLPPSTFTPQHLALLHHVETQMSSDILGFGKTPAIVGIAIQHANECPYLLDQLLAFSAMHLAHKSPEAAASYRHQATELQTRAVAYFNAQTQSLATEELLYPIPRFLFAAMLSLHVLAETLAYHRSDFHHFIDRFIECIHLHWGIRPVIKPTWQLLLESELGTILSITIIQKPEDPLSGSETLPLHALVNNSDLSPSSIAACRETIAMLQWAFDLTGRLPTQDLPHGVSGFSVLVPGDFVGILRKHQPEALVILAYYGVLLHRARKYWICGDNGQFMIRSIAQHLGTYWADAMRYPLSVLENEQD